MTRHGATSAGASQLTAVRGVGIFAVAFLVAVGACRALALPAGNGGEFVFWGAVVALALLIDRTVRVADRWTAVGAAVLALPLAAATTVGRRIDPEVWPPVAPMGAALLPGLALTAGFFVALVPLLHLLEGRRSVPLHPRSRWRRWWAVASVAMFMAWLPYLVIFFPGNLTPDSFDSLAQGLGLRPLVNHHPIAFITFVGALARTGQLFDGTIAGIAVFSVTQMVLMATALGYVVGWLARRGLPRVVPVAVAAFFAVDPVIACYSATMWKDVLFGAWIMLFCLVLFDVVLSRGDRLAELGGVAQLTVLALLLSFWRSNGFYVAVATLLVVLAVFRHRWRPVALVLTVVAVSYLTVQGPVMSALGIRGAHFVETVGLPLQQITYAIRAGGDVSPRTQELMAELMPLDRLVELHSPHSPDPIKFDPAFNNSYLDEHAAEFIQAWLETGRRNPGAYASAWAVQTLGYYHIGTTDWIIARGFRDNLTPELAGLAAPQLVPDSVPEGVRVLETGLRTGPGISAFYSIAASLWLVAVFAVSVAVRRRWLLVVPVLPLLFMWATLLVAAPAMAEFRYAFGAHLTIPILLALIWFTPADGHESGDDAQGSPRQDGV